MISYDGVMAPPIRRMTLDDAPDVTRLHVDAWQTAYRGILPDEILDGLDYEERLAARRTHLSDPDNPVVNWVLEDEGLVRAWAAAGRPRDDDLGDETIELYAIYARPVDVGKGYGRALIEYVMDYARAQHATELTLWVLGANERTLRFYAAAGLRADPRQKPLPFRETGAEKMRLHRRL